MKKILAICMIAAVLAAASSAQAGIVSTSLTVNSTTAIPGSLITGAFDSDEEMWVFIEQEDFVLGQDLEVDITEAGVYAPGEFMDNREEDLTPGTILEGTTVNSYIVHFDEASGDSLTITGQIVFDQECLGLIILTDYLNDSDSIVGNSGTTYSSPTNDSDWNSVRGLDILTYSQDPLELTISINQCTIDFTLTTKDGIDEFRVIEVPEPATLCLLGLGGLLFRRKRSKA